MKTLLVWVRDAHSDIRLAGTLVTTDPAPGSGRYRSEFEYASGWSSAPGSFALDPESLPLDARRTQADLLYPPLAVFDDALPDDWGQRLLGAALKQERIKPTAAEMLLRMRGGGTGALLFTEQADPPQAETTLHSSSLPALLSTAEKFEAGTLPTDAEFRKLLQGSSRAGGARPKALVHDETGVEWIAKFPGGARDDGHDIVGLEAACVQLARQAGLTAPEARLQTMGRRRVLLVRRFDVTAGGGRIHMISMRTLCRERPGVYAHGYSQLAQVLRKHSAEPVADIAMLFRQMVFNAAIGNVDDHLKNFWMLGGASGYRLAPAFDLVPDTTGRAEHTLAFRYSNHCPTGGEFKAIADNWDVKDAGRIVGEVIDAALAFSPLTRKLNVGGGKRLEHVCDDIRKRIARLRTG